MTYNDVYDRYLLLCDLGKVKLPASAATEVILLKVHYRKGINEFEAARQEILQSETDDDIKRNALNEKANEKIDLEDRRLSKSSFEKIVEATSSEDDIITLAFGAGENKIHLDVWLMTFAEQLVDN